MFRGSIACGPVLRHTGLRRQTRLRHVFSLFVAPPSEPSVSGLFRFVLSASSRRKDGPGMIGVWKLSGLGSRFDSPLLRPRPKSHSGQRLDGDGNKVSARKRLGRADMGVSILLFCAVELGGFGLAKGFGGPPVPALSKALALGEGGGRTTPDEWLPSVPAPLADGAPPAVPLDPRGEQSTSALPSGDSSGICTFSCGRLPPWALAHRALSVRRGGSISGRDDIDVLPRVWVACLPNRGGGAPGPLM